MYAKSSGHELAESIRSEMLDDIVFQDNLGKESKVPYTDFFSNLRQQEMLVPHLELVSCITPIDELYPAIYDCFVKDYGHVDFGTYPKSVRKFSPLLFTLCLDFVNNNGVILLREYTKQGKNIAYLEKLLYSEIHYFRLDSVNHETVYYRDFLDKVMKDDYKSGSSLDRLMLEAQEILLSNSQKIEVNENAMLLFSEIFEGVVSHPRKTGKIARAGYAEDLQFMFSSVGIYTCVNHINKIGDIKTLLPVMYVTSAAGQKKTGKVAWIIIAVVVTAVIAGLLKVYS